MLALYCRRSPRPQLSKKAKGRMQQRRKRRR